MFVGPVYKTQPNPTHRHTRTLNVITSSWVGLGFVNWTHEQVWIVNQRRSHRSTPIQQTNLCVAETQPNPRIDPSYDHVWAVPFCWCHTFRRNISYYISYLWVDNISELLRSTTVDYRSDRHALVTAWFRRAGQLATANSCMLLVANYGTSVIFLRCIACTRRLKSLMVALSFRLKTNYRLRCMSS